MRFKTAQRRSAKRHARALDTYSYGQFSPHLPLEERARLIQEGAAGVQEAPVHHVLSRGGSVGAAGAATGLPLGFFLMARPFYEHLARETPPSVLRAAAGPAREAAQAAWLRQAGRGARLLGAGSGALAGFGVGALLGMLRGGRELGEMDELVETPTPALIEELRRRDIGAARAVDQQNLAARSGLHAVRSTVSMLPFLAM